MARSIGSPVSWSSEISLHFSTCLKEHFLQGVLCEWEQGSIFRDICIIFYFPPQDLVTSTWRVMSIWRRTLSHGARNQSQGFMIQIDHEKTLLVSQSCWTINMLQDNRCLQLSAGLALCPIYSSIAMESVKRGEMQTFTLIAPGTCNV